MDRDNAMTPRKSPSGQARRRWLVVVLSMLILVGIGGTGWMLIPPQPYVPIAGLDPTQLSIIALGDQGTGKPMQWKVGRAMESVAEREGRLDAVFLLGDNFYGKSLTGINDWNWQLKFERVYSGQWLSHVPFYATLGNHDYPTSQKFELEYAAQHKGSGRWQMPAHTYMRDFGGSSGQPLLRVVFLDTSADKTTLPQQIDFLEQAFQSPPAPVWRMVAAHHPVRNAGSHGEDQQLTADLLPALERNQVDLYLSGHDHDQQLLLHEGEPAWLVSGGGGQTLYKLDKSRTDATFALSRPGFVKLDFNASDLKIAYYNEHGEAQIKLGWARACPWMAKGCLAQVNAKSSP